jgi:hypothetical protein
MPVTRETNPLGGFAHLSCRFGQVHTGGALRAKPPSGFVSRVSTDEILVEVTFS